MHGIKIALALALLALAALLAGCTRIHYEPGKSITYWSVLQKKSLSVTPGPGGAAITYATDSDAAVELAQELTAMSREMRAIQGGVK